MTQTNIDPVAHQSVAVQEMAGSWDLIKVLLGGTKAIRKAGEQFLPKWPLENDKAYENRVNASTLHPVFKRTLNILASKPFSKPIVITEETPEDIKEWAKDIDLQGRNLHAFASEVFRQALGYGITGVLVDFPTVSVDEVRTEVQEKSAGVRPYFVKYAPWDILGGRWERKNGLDRLVQLRLMEHVIEPVGLYGEKPVDQVRVLTPGNWELLRQDDKGNWTTHDHGVTTLQEIPFVMFYGARTGFMTGEPPLIELAYQNIEHYQSSSDQQNILHVARVPILTVIGGNNDDDINAGSSSLIKLPLGADMKFVEHTGAAIGAGRQSIVDLEDRMRQTGAELLLLKPGQVTAAEVFSDDEGNKCDLQRAAEAAQDSLNQCLQFMADWVGKPDGGGVELYTEFGEQTLSDASARLLFDMNMAGKLSDETLFSEFKRKNKLSPELDFKKEKDLIEKQGPPLGNIGVEVPAIDEAVLETQPT